MNRLWENNTINIANFFLLHIIFAVVSLDLLKSLQIEVA